jgi:hypothetical protein
MSSASDDARLPPALQAVVDKSVLQDLVLTYCRACDRRDFALVRTLYHDDAIDDHGRMFRGSPDEFVKWLPTAMGQFEATVHSITNSLFAIDGDRAEGEHYTVAYHRGHPPDAQEVIVGGRYLDRYEKRQGVWKFLHRSLVLDWAQVRAVDAAAYGSFAAGAVLGTIDANDPSYHELSLLKRLSK